MPVYDIKAPDGRIFKVNAPENAKQEDLFAFVQQQITAEALRQEQQRQTGILETFGRGVSRGFGRLASTVTDTIPALAGSALGFDEYARRQLKEAEEKEAARQAASPTLYRSIEDIRGPGTALGYAAETIGEQIANFLPGVGFGVTGAKLGAGAASSALTRNLGASAAQRGLSGEAAEEFIQRGLAAAQPAVTRGATRGALGGAFLGSYAQAAPEIFQNIAEDSGQLAPAASLLFGSVNAALDSILPYKLSQQLTGPMRAGITAKLLEKSGMDRGVLRSVTAGALGGVATEGLTEGAQEAISIAAERFVNENPGVFGSKEWERILESTIRGSVAGGSFGTVGGGIEGIREGMQRKARYDELTNFRAEREQNALQAQQDAVESLTAPGEELVRKGLASAAIQSPAGIAGLAVPGGAAGEVPSIMKTIAGVQGEMEEMEQKFAPTEKQKAAQERQQTQQAKDAENLQKAQEKLARKLEADAEAKRKAGVAGLTAPAEELVSQGPAAFLAGQRLPLENLIQQAQTFKGGQKPLPPVEPPILETAVPTRDQYKNQLGIKSKRVLDALEGRDLSDPAQARDIKDILDAYGRSTQTVGLAGVIESFLATHPAFQSVPAPAPTPQEAQNVGEPVAGAGGEGAGVAGEPGIDTAPGAAGPVESTGVEVAGGTAGEPAAGEGAAPGALTPETSAEVAAPAVESETVQTAVETPPVPVAETPAKIAAPETEPAPDLPALKAQRDALLLRNGKRPAPNTKNGKAFDALDAQIKALEPAAPAAKVAAPVVGEPKPTKKAKKAEPATEKVTKGRTLTAAKAEEQLSDLELDPDTTKAKVRALAKRMRDSDLISENESNEIERILKDRDMGPEDALGELKTSFRVSEAKPAAEPAPKPETKKTEAAPEPKIVRPEKAAGTSRAKLLKESERLKGELQKVIDSPAATTLQKVSARDHLNLLSDPELNETTADIKANHKLIQDSKNKKLLLPLVPKAGQDLIGEAVNDWVREYERTNNIKLLPVPAYKGRSFSGSERELLEKGDTNEILDSLIASEKNPALRQVLRRIRALNLKTKIKIAPTSKTTGGLYQRDSAPSRDERFKQTREAQRYGFGVTSRKSPEDLGTQFTYGGRLQTLLEHVGDLVNRAAMPSNPREGGAGVGSGGVPYGLEAMREKAGRALRDLERSKASEYTDQINRNADYFVREGEAKSKEAFVAEADAWLKEYADAYAQIPVHTKLQELSRDAAVALGKKDFAAAKRALQQIDKLINSDKAESHYEALLDDPFTGPETGSTPLGKLTEIEVDGVKRPALNSEGRPIHPTQEGVRNFWRWFGDSKAVDEQGRPIRIYRGLNSTDERGLNAEPREEYAAFGSSSPYVSNTYANPDKYSLDTVPGSVLPLYVKAEKLIEYPTRLVGGERRFDMFDFDRVAMRLKPGEVLVVRDIVDMGPRASVTADPKKLYSYPADTYSWNKGTSVKSATGNEGTFDPNNPDIRYLPARGMYDPATDTIYLDPEHGMSTHTFVHEVVHAAISKVLDNRSHPLTKQFEQFFLSVQGRLGMAYGAQDIQEFAAELVSNPSFQALLKSIKTPKSESLFRHILRSIAEFLGFSSKSNAFNQGLDFVNDIIDVSGSVEPTSMEKLFLGNGDLSIVSKVGKAMPALTGETVENTRNYLSNLSPKFLRTALGLLRLDNIYTLYKKELPSIKALMDAIEMRAGSQERQIAQTQKKYKEMVAVERKYRAQMQRMSDIAVEARLEEVDILDPDFIPTAAQSAAYTRLKNQFQSMPKPVQDVYRTIRKDYDASFYRHRKILINAAETSESLATKLRDKFKLEKPLVSYVPFLRSGDFWVSYTDPETDDPAAYAFESLREREQFIKLLDQKKVEYKVYQNLDDIRYTSESIPQSSFVYKVMQELRGQGAADAHLDAVWQSYLATFPSGSIMKQFMKSKNVRGMERDIIRGYGDVMIRWARKLANAEYGPQIDSALYKIREEARAQSDPAVNAAADNVLGQAQFLHNPTFNGLTTAATTASYFMFMAGNISSALINTLSLPMMVWPKLVGDFNWDAATRASLTAGRTAMNNWGENPKYKKLHETLTDHAQLEHTQAREVLEGRRQKTSDFNSLKAKVMDGLSIPLAVTEKYNRAVTAIAAYDLMKGKGASEADAIQYALQTVKDLHTSGMSATGPRWMQNALGRVFFTFKSFVWNQAFVTARAFHQAFKGETPEVRKAAQRQLLAMYAMTFAFAGMRGLPFYGAISTMAQMINALFGDEDEPFDFDQFMKDTTNDFLFKGAFNYATNLEVATRAGVANDLLFRDDPRFIAEHGYMLFAMTQALGPASSLLMNAGRGYEQFQDGEIWRSFETVSPSWVRNGSKGLRYMLEGATTLKGDPVMEDIGVYNSLMQGIGFAPADLADRYERLQAGKGYERELGLRRTNILRLYDMARQAGDTELLGEARERITKFNETNPALRITQSTLDRSLRARLAAEKEMINGVRFNKNLRPIIEERFFSEDED